MQTKKEGVTGYISNYCATYQKAFIYGPCRETQNSAQPTAQAKRTLNVPAHPTRVHGVTRWVTGMHV